MVWNLQVEIQVHFCRELEIPVHWPRKLLLEEKKLKNRPVAPTNLPSTYLCPSLLNVFDKFIMVSLPDGLRKPPWISVVSWPKIVVDIRASARVPNECHLPHVAIHGASSYKITHSTTQKCPWKCWEKWTFLLVFLQTKFSLCFDSYASVHATPTAGKWEKRNSSIPRIVVV